MLNNTALEVPWIILTNLSIRTVISVLSNNLWTPTATRQPAALSRAGWNFPGHRIYPLPLNFYLAHSVPRGGVIERPTEALRVSFTMVIRYAADKPCLLFFADGSVSMGVLHVICRFNIRWCTLKALNKPTSFYHVFVAHMILFLLEISIYFYSFYIHQIVSYYRVTAIILNVISI